MSKRSDAVDMIRGMVLAAAAAVAKGEAVRTELKDEFDTERLKVRVFIGTKSADLPPIEGVDVDYVMSDETVRRQIEGFIQEALADLSTR